MPVTAAIPTRPPRQVKAGWGHRHTRTPASPKLEPAAPGQGCPCPTCARTPRSPSPCPLGQGQALAERGKSREGGRGGPTCGQVGALHAGLGLHPAQQVGEQVGPLQEALEALLQRAHAAPSHPQLSGAERSAARPEPLARPPAAPPPRPANAGAAGGAHLRAHARARSPTPTPTHLCAHKRTCTHTYRCTQVRTCVCRSHAPCTHVHQHACTRAPAHAHNRHAFPGTHPCTYTHTRAPPCIDTHAHMHARTHACTPAGAHIVHLHKRTCTHTYTHGSGSALSHARASWVHLPAPPPFATLSQSLLGTVVPAAPRGRCHDDPGV